MIIFYDIIAGKMKQTLTQKILAGHAGLDRVEPGQLIWAKVDLALGNDITAPIAIREFKQIGAEKVFDKNRVVLVPDHFTPNKDIKSAEQCKILRDFARAEELANYFEIGQMGVEHALLPEQGLVVPDDIIIGADSHTCTYGALSAFSTGVGSTDLASVMALGKVWLRVPAAIKVVLTGKLQPWVTGKDLILYLIGQIGVDGARYMSLEFTGPTIADLTIDSRLAMANMAIEAGGKNGIFPYDKVTEKYLREVFAAKSGSTRAADWQRFLKDKPLAADPDAEYARTVNIDAGQVELQVSFPHLPSNAKPISRVGEVKIDQVVIGSCTNGRMEDLRLAAKILKGNKVAGTVRTIVIPATQQIYKQAMKEGLLEIFVDSGAAVSTPTCGPCLGGHMGILAADERAVATTNRNFIGRMGDPKSEVYLAGPAVAAASAITGKISGPDEVK